MGARPANSRLNTRGDDGYLLKKGRIAGRKTGAGFSVSWEETEDVKVELDARYLAALVRDTIVKSISQSILAGMKADGTGRQKPLKQDAQQGVAARAGRRPNIRGNTGSGDNKFYDLIIGTSVSGNESRATFEVKPDNMHAAFVSKEMDRGVEYFVTPQHEIDKAVAFWAQFAVDGKIPNVSLGPVRARDLK